MNDFDKTIWNEMPTLVVFYATWCGSCQALEPTIDRFCKKNNGRVMIRRIDMDDAGMLDVVRRHHITQVPTLILFRRGEMLWRRSGSVDYEKLERAFEGIEELEVLEQR